ncbi:MAG: exodeoxyribonuclease VII small subunit [Lachnospiraceae bacterium]|nr:exodeoxyribonuclease VII small subunit [Lachnospiraceae bacterium]
MEKEVFQLEVAFDEIEQIIESLESDEVSLKDSIELYAKGAKLVAQCKEELQGIEKEIIIIGEELESKTQN